MAPVLGLDGLATVCDVELNGQMLLSSDNMFVAHRVALGELLRDVGNELRLKVHALSPLLGQRRPRPRWRVPMLRQQQLRWWRTSLLGRTPGWSLPAPPVGPWRPVWLDGAHATLTERLSIRPHLEGDRGWLDIELADAPNEPMVLALRRRGQCWQVPLVRQPSGMAQARLRVDSVERWWPHTHGEPALYDLAIRLGDGPTSLELPVASVGFREIRWRREGGDFALSVNGVPVFVRGACWTPLDPLSLHAADECYGTALAQVSSAGLNMLRVCGPMVYEADAFHRACDAAGVLVWQDFMFANMDYPADDAAFAASVKQEVRQQLMRWQGSPSLAVLCGNSEVSQQAAMLGVDRSLWEPALFHQTLPAWCAEQLPDTAYWPSSSHGGALPFAPASGTCSYYGVGAYQRPVDDARSSGLRFASECLAFAQVPDAQALDRMPGGRSLRTHHPAWKQRTPRDLGAGWDFEDVRDHYLATSCAVDPATLRREDPERYLMLSRVAVARVVQACFSRWRTQGSSCQGALVWYLRDAVAGAGWGFLDETGAPKSAWFAMSRVLQPLALLVTDEGLNGLQLHLVNETSDAVDARLRLQVCQGRRLLHAHEGAHTLAPRSVQALDASALIGQFFDLNGAYRFGPSAADMVHAVLEDAQGHTLARTHHWCGQWPAMTDDTNLFDAGARDLPDGDLMLELHGHAATVSLQIDTPGWRPEDNCFDLAPGEHRRVRLRSARHAGAAPPVWRGTVQAAQQRWPVPVKLSSGAPS